MTDHSSAAGVPAGWMPAAAMRRIHIHWTAGTHTASDYERTRYHLLVEGDGSLRRGVSIAANAPGSGMVPASHTKNANTGAIGLSLCGMAGAVDHPFDPGDWPLTGVQWQRMLAVAADLARHYAIPVTPRTVLTHAEVGPNLGIAQAGKWDITRLPFAPGVIGAAAVGALLRDGVAALLARQPPGDWLRVFGVAPATLNLRAAPAGARIGRLREGDRVLALERMPGWVRVDGPAGPGWAAEAWLRPD